jgi:hypothetical protein
MATKRKNTVNDTNVDHDHDTNPDPITGAPGSHPLGTGVGAASMGAAGAAIGSMAGPVGTVVGAAVGAVAGGYAGKAAAEAIDPTAEDAYWRENYRDRPYAANYDYDTLRPAYQYGWEARGRYGQKRFDEVEPELQKNWRGENVRSNLGWDKARYAARDAWDRIERAIPGDADRDGK